MRLERLVRRWRLQWQILKGLSKLTCTSVTSVRRISEQLSILLTDHFYQILSVFEHTRHLIEWIKVLHRFESLDKAVYSGSRLRLHHCFERLVY